MSAGQAIRISGQRTSSDGVMGAVVQIGAEEYRVTDVRHQQGGTMLYAERQAIRGGRPHRAAFRLDDVIDHVLVGA
ncbi:MAG: hypothetical protein NXH85_05420 [Pseudomonadaceae bacterium]|nr:hypothetical protein [Pseudomonadaceae bacterium]